MKKDELKKFLENHKKWVENKGGSRADLCGANLRSADLRDANLCGANLQAADLCGAKLRAADLRDANLCGANLQGADLRAADLQGANLCAADLCGAKLRTADLQGADLRAADLHATDLRAADLRAADLQGADLGSADLRAADLQGANLQGVIANPDTTFFHIACPEEGSFIGYKKAGDKIVVLEIPSDAKRSSATTFNCRCSKAKVLRIENLDGTPADVAQVESNYDPYFIYTVGEIVEVPNFDGDRWVEHGSGIHFFVNKENAKNYLLY